MGALCPPRCPRGSAGVPSIPTGCARLGVCSCGPAGSFVAPQPLAPPSTPTASCHLPLAHAHLGHLLLPTQHPEKRPAPAGLPQAHTAASPQGPQLPWTTACTGLLPAYPLPSGLAVSPVEQHDDTSEPSQCMPHPCPWASAQPYPCLRSPRKVTSLPACGNSTPLPLPPHPQPAPPQAKAHPSVQRPSPSPYVCR